MSATDGPKLLTRRKVKFPELINDLLALDNEGYWFSSVGVDVAFELYRWMCTNARDRTRYPNVIECIGNNGSGDGSTAPGPFGATWLHDLRRRILRALRGGSSVARWRREEKIDPAGSKVVPYPFWERGLSRDSVDRLFALASPERRTKQSYNSSHPKARAVDRVQLVLAEKGWQVVLWYSYPDHGSHWMGPRVAQKTNEPFSDFIERAYKELDALLTKGCAPKHRRGMTVFRQRWSACSAGYSGWDLPKEIVGGVLLADRVASTPCNPATPPKWILLPGNKYPSEVRPIKDRPGLFAHIERERERRPHESDWTYWESRHSPKRALTLQQVHEGFVRYVLTEAAMRRSFLDMTPEESSRAQYFFAPTDGYSGSGPRSLSVAAEINAIGGPSATPYQDAYKAERLHCEIGREDAEEGDPDLSDEEGSSEGAT